MSSKKSGQTLHLEPRSSCQFALLLLFVHGLALVVAANLTMPVWASLAVSAAVLINFYTTFNTHVLGRGRYAVLSLVWDDEGDWKLITAEGEEIEALLMPNSYVHTHILVLNFRVLEGGRRTVILLRDSLDQRTYRELQVRIRMEAS